VERQEVDRLAVELSEDLEVVDLEVDPVEMLQVVGQVEDLEVRQEALQVDLEVALQEVDREGHQVVHQVAGLLVRQEDLEELEEVQACPKEDQVAL
jgi:hypothetical protein